MLLQTIRLGRHGFYGLGRGKNFTARERRKDISPLGRCAPEGQDCKNHDALAGWSVTTLLFYF